MALHLAVWRVGSTAVYSAEMKAVLSVGLRAEQWGDCWAATRVVRLAENLAVLRAQRTAALSDEHSAVS